MVSDFIAKTRPAHKPLSHGKEPPAQPFSDFEPHWHRSHSSPYFLRTGCGEKLSGRTGPTDFCGKYLLTTFQS